MNNLSQVVEFKNQETQQFFSSVVASSQRLVYAKWRKGNETNKEDLRNVRLELAVAMLNAPDGDAKTKAAVVSAMCEEDSVLASILREYGWCVEDGTEF